MTFVKIVRVFLAQSIYTTHLLIRCYVQVLTLQTLLILPGFNMHLVINKCVTAHSLKLLSPLSPRLFTFRYEYFWLYQYNL